MGRVELGLTEVEFWRMTPRYYRALLSRQRDYRERAQQQADMRAGVLAAVMANTFGGKKRGGAFKPSDFFSFPPIGKVTPAVKPKPMPQKMIEQLWHNWAKAAGAQPTARVAS